MASLQRSMARRAVRDFYRGHSDSGGSGLFRKLLGKWVQPAVPPWRLRNGKPKKKARKVA